MGQQKNVKSPYKLDEEIIHVDIILPYIICWKRSKANLMLKFVKMIYPIMEWFEIKNIVMKSDDDCKININYVPIQVYFSNINQL